MTRPVDEMTLDEVRDEIARLEGWVYNPNAEFRDEAWMRGKQQMPRDRHPIPATLDAAAELPEGWIYLSVVWLNGVRLWQAAALSTKTWTDITTSGTAELLARFRLRLAVLRATKKGASDEESI